MNRQTILITGASAGLGRGMAREFARSGRSLALCARRTDALEELRQELLASQPALKISIKALDVNDYPAVFAAFREFQQEFGRLDRIIVNAGIGKGVKIGTGGFKANLQTAQTNFCAALAQCEAAMEIFREQNDGHLVTVSSMSAFRGARGTMSTYAATKAGLASLSEGIRLDVMGTPIKVTTLYPGYILTDINREIANAPFRVDEVTGCRAMVKAIEAEPHEACVPRWPWSALRPALAAASLPMLKRMM